MSSTIGYGIEIEATLNDDENGEVFISDISSELDGELVVVSSQSEYTDNEDMRYFVMLKSTIVKCGSFETSAKVIPFGTIPNSGLKKLEKFVKEYKPNVLGSENWYLTDYYSY